MSRAALIEALAARLGRASRAGFRTDEVLYHGTPRNVREFRDGLIFLTPDPKIASVYAKGKGLSAMFGHGEGAQVMPVVTRGRLKQIDDTISMTDELAREVRQAKREGYAGLDLQAMLDRGRLGPQRQVVMFRGRDVRSPNARFSDLSSGNVMAGVGGALGAGALLREVLRERESA